MAMSGTRPTSAELSSITQYLYLQYDWSVTFNTDTMKALWRVSATVKRSSNGTSSKNYATRVSGNDYIKFNGVTVWSHGPGYYNNNTLHPYVYTGDQSVCAEQTSPTYYNGTLRGKKPYGLAHLLMNYAFETDINENGYTSLTVTTQLTGAASPADILPANNYTFVPDTVELYTKIPYKTSNGWENGYIWYKDATSGWVKKYLYRKDRAATQTDSGWVRK